MICHYSPTHFRLSSILKQIFIKTEICLSNSQWICYTHFTSELHYSLLKDHKFRAPCPDHLPIIFEKQVYRGIRPLSACLKQEVSYTDEQRQRAEEAEQKAQDAEQKAQDAAQKAEIGISLLIEHFQAEGMSKDAVMRTLVERMGLKEAQAQSKVEIYWKKADSNA